MRQQKISTNSEHQNTESNQYHLLVNATCIQYSVYSKVLPSFQRLIPKVDFCFHQSKLYTQFGTSN